MPRIGIDVNLPTGDQYDLLVVSTATFPAGQLTFKFEATPRKIAGLQKVAQTFLRMLLTTKGSDVIYPQLGTAFHGLAFRSNRSSGDSVFIASLTAAVKDAEAQTKMILNRTNGDAASQLSTIEILGLTTVTDSLTMFAQITTLAGDQASIALPFPQLDLTLANG